MISLMTFIVYNSLFAFSMLPSANLKPAGAIVTDIDKISPKNSLLPDIYMHIFVRQNEEIDFDQYIPYVEPISNKYPKFKYHFIVVVNDTNLGWLSAEENNEIALNTLWTKDPKKETILNNNIIIEHVTLSAYMENSPLRKHWRTLPYQLVEFLARAVSIWDKGGVAFNPIILTPRSQHTIYKEKLQKLLNKYAYNKNILSDFKVVNKSNKTAKKERKLNNIRDIINALESEDNSINDFSQQTLSEAENKKASILTRNERHLLAATETVAENETKKNTEPINHNLLRHINAYSSNSDTKESKHGAIVNSNTESTRALDISYNTTKLSLLPLFLEFLFHNKLDVKPNPTEATNKNRTRKSVIEIPKPEDKKSSLSTHSLNKEDRKIVNNYKPVIVSAVGIYNRSEYVKGFIETPTSSKETDESLEINRLTIDLKGNIIATDTACHAFLGTVFSNAIRHSEEESVTDFIIAELTIFCKGLLSSCMGIDLILL